MEKNASFLYSWEEKSKIPRRKRGKEYPQMSHMEGDRILEKYRETFKFNTNQRNSAFNNQHLSASTKGTKSI